MGFADLTRLHARTSERVTDTSFAACLDAARESRWLSQEQLADRSWAQSTQIRGPQVRRSDWKPSIRPRPRGSSASPRVSKVRRCVTTRQSSSGQAS